MAVPKRKKSKSKRDKRRTHQKAAIPSLPAVPSAAMQGFHIMRVPAVAPIKVVR